MPAPEPGLDGATRALFQAARAGEVGALAQAVARGANLAAEDRGQTPLGAAAGSGSGACVAWLLAHGCAVGALSRSGWAPLEVAAYNDRTECLAVLLEAGADPWQHARHNGEKGNDFCAACWVAARGSPASLRCMLPFLGRVDRRVERGHTLLMIAVANGRCESVKELLAHGADPAARAEAGRSVLRFAMTGDDAATASLILDRGGLAGEADGGSGLLVLRCAAGHRRTARLLVESGVDVNGLDAEGCSPLVAACGGRSGASGDDGLCRFLLARGAEADGGCDKDGNGALALAVQADNLPLVRQLLAGGADPNRTNKTSLPALAFTKSADMAWLLLDAGADPGARHAWTPLQGRGVDGAIDAWLAARERSDALQCAGARPARRLRG